MMGYRWLLFDADGTLFDYDAAEAEALAATFEGSGIEYRPAYLEDYRRINAEMWLEFERGTTTQSRLKTERFEILFSQTRVEADAEHFSSMYLENLSRRTDLIAGAQKTVERLTKDSRALLITNGIAAVQRPRFSSSPLLKYLSGFVISEEVGAAKPAPEIFEAAFVKMGCPDLNDVLMIGDSLTSDIKGGNDFGIDTCWFNPGGMPPDPEIEPTYEITSLRELLTIADLG
jgi:2-haloacid dehalogenase